MSSIYRCLHGIFRKSVNVAPNAENVILTTSPAPTKTKARTTRASLSQKHRQLKEEVRKFKQSSNSSRFRSNYRNYDSIVRRLASAKQFSLIQDALEHQKKYKEIATERFAVRLLNLYGKAGMFDHAQKMFDEMPDLNIERTVLSVNALLAACVASKKFDKFDELLRELPAKLSVDPDVVTYNTVIKAFCEMESFDKALLVLEQMEGEGLEPNLISFNTLLDEYYRIGRFSDGEKIWEMMENKNVNPNIRSYNSKLRGLVLEGRVSEAVELFDELRTKGLKPDIFSFNALVKGFCTDGNLEEAKKWYNELLKCKCVPDGMTVSTLLPFLCENGDAGMALEMCKDVIKRRFLVDTALFQLVVDGLVKESKMEEAMELVKLGRSNDHFCYKLELCLDK